MRLMEKYNKEIVPALKEKFGYKNVNAVPKIKKVVLNVGINSNKKDAKFFDVVESVLTRISGQKPVKTRARKSISNFKIREGMVVGMMVTMRGKRMYDFLEKLLSITFPRVRDFRGISTKIIDKQGNLNFGFKEFIAFPEIGVDEVENMHGVEVSVQSTAGNKEVGEALYRLLGFPFKD